jgi:hypothetical protein
MDLLKSETAANNPSSASGGDIQSHQKQNARRLRTGKLNFPQ